MSRVFKTATGMTLHLKPVSGYMVQKVEIASFNNKNKSAEEIAPIYLALLSELFEEGITKFDLTSTQAALVTLTRPELKKVIPGLPRNISDFALFIFSQVKTYEDLTALALAILEVTDKTKKPDRVKPDWLGVFSRLIPIKG